MPRYAISFDVDHARLRADGYSDSQINNEIYRDEVRAAMSAAGFSDHPEGSVYHTPELAEAESLAPIVRLQSALQSNAPTFCKYVRSIHIYEMKGRSDITTIVQSSTLPGLRSPAGRP